MGNAVSKTQTVKYLRDGAATLAFLSLADSLDQSSFPFLLICCGVRKGYFKASKGRCSIMKCFKFVLPSLGGVTGQLVRLHGDINGEHLKASMAVVSDDVVDDILESNL